MYPRLHQLIMWKESAHVSDKERNEKIDKENPGLRMVGLASPKDVATSVGAQGLLLGSAAPALMQMKKKPTPESAAVLQKLLKETKSKLVTSDYTDPDVEKAFAKQMAEGNKKGLLWKILHQGYNWSPEQILDTKGPHYNPDLDYVAVPSEARATMKFHERIAKKSKLQGEVNARIAAEREAWTKASDSLDPQMNLPGKEWAARQKEHFRSYPSSEYVKNIPEDLRPGTSQWILAHEVGHSLQGALKKPLGKYLYGAGPAGLGASSLYVMGTKDEKKARNAAIAGTVSALPMVGIEADASRRGAALLRKVNPEGGKILQSLKPFVGVGSYSTAAALPLLLYYIRKQLGRYKTPGTVANA